MSDFDNMAKAFRKSAESIDNVVYQEVGLFGQQILGDAKGLAPSDSGDLQDSLTMSDIVKESGNYEIVIGSPLKYATRRHEEPYRKGYHDKYQKGVKYAKYYFNGRGEKTREKPNIDGRKPGRKYLENAFLINQKNVSKLEKRIMARILNGGVIDD